ncbi:Uncharacterized protein QJS10_CPB04g00634 [Acorus calamus]|uniref:Ribosomal protein L34Ae n=1 Tax=Acorus calamus TaxID=4465 RepID=A0AAV9F012_ACOCL|nr:Uncharacterized protein QJS10_CPB04g00634 [Acorus calamus]
MVDCRSLIEFCRAFEQHRNTTASASKNPNQTHNSRRRSKSLNPLSHPFCSHSPFAAIDAVILLLVIGALGVLTFPYLTFLLQRPLISSPSRSISSKTSFTKPRSRKCGNPYCQGLKKAVEFDIQLESEECVKYLPPVPRDVLGVKPLELGRDREELEAELKKMAPLNGRTVLIFRAPCGCPAGRMEVWGAKKVRRIKK